MCDFCEKEVRLSNNDIMEAMLLEYCGQKYLYTAVKGHNFMRIFKIDFCPICGRDLRSAQNDKN